MRQTKTSTSRTPQKPSATPPLSESKMPPVPKIAEDQPEALKQPSTPQAPAKPNSISQSESPILQLLREIAVAYIRSDSSKLSVLIKKFSPTDAKRIEDSMRTYRVKESVNQAAAKKVDDATLKCCTPVNTWIEKWGTPFLRTTDMKLSLFSFTPQTPS